MLLAAAIIFVCKGTVEAFISTPVSALFGLPLLWIGLGVGIVLILFVAALVPGWLYNRTPVSVAFRGFDANRHRWKLGLLAVEFAVVGLMLSLLWVISSQYRKMTSLDPGYDYHSVAILTVDGLDSNQRMQCLTEVGRMPQVMMTSSASCLPIEGWFGSGNDVLLALGDKVLFNAEDFYFVGKDFFRLFAIPLEEGRIPTAGPAISASDITRGRTLLVDETFARKLRHAAHWKDGVVGKRIFVSEHCNEQYPTVTIVGVFRNIRIGSVSQSASVLRRPSMMFYGGDAVMPDMLLKFNDLTAETMRQVRDKVSRMYPGKNASLVSYATEYEKQYIMERNFRNGILIGGIVVFIIALFGLVGYTSDEVNRRSKEVAIRKVNGARVGDILRLFIKDIVKTAVPGIVVGCVGAWLIAAQWLQSFSERITLTPWPFLCVTVAILAVITAAVSINCWRIANSNPVNYLKDE